MEAMFIFMPQSGNKIPDKAIGLLYQKDFVKYLEENEGVSIVVSLEHEVVKSEKKKLYRYLNGVLIPALMRAKRESGETCDKVACMISMKAEYAKDIYVNRKGESMAILMSQEDMTKSRLLQFIKDIIQHLEEWYGVEAPDASRYLLTNYK